ncbi:MAG: alpha/beta hydrolase [Schumannella sp.]|nr:alpha/beta hydrolase [Microbacteriaceae bacterium]
MHFASETSSDGIVERRFAIDGVPGALWSPVAAADGAPLVLSGHPGGLHMLVPAVMRRAIQLVSARGFHVAAIDAPGHGDRPRSEEDAAWVARMQAAREAGEPLGPIVSEFNGLLAERAVPEWRATLDALLDELGPVPVGYRGMTLATEIGARLIAADDRIRVAVLGAAVASDALMDAMRCITIPVTYLLPWDDPEIDRESGIAIFGALGSSEKRMVAFSRPHQRVPWSEVEEVGAFLARHLAG